MKNGSGRSRISSGDFLAIRSWSNMFMLSLCHRLSPLHIF